MVMGQKSLSSREEKDRAVPVAGARGLGVVGCDWPVDRLLESRHNGFCRPVEIICGGDLYEEDKARYQVKARLVRLNILLGLACQHI